MVKDLICQLVHYFITLNTTMICHPEEAGNKGPPMYSRHSLSEKVPKNDIKYIESLHPSAVLKSECTSKHLTWYT